MPECMVHSHRKGKCSCKDIMNQLVWNNKYILNDGKSLFYTFFNNTCRIRKVGDLVSQDNIFLGSGKISAQHFLLLWLISVIPNEWRSTIMGKVFMLNSSPFLPSPPPPLPYPFIENCFQVPIRGKMFVLSSISEILYRVPSLYCSG